MAGRRVHVVMDASLVERIDEALRGESRGEFVRRAVERALESRRDSGLAQAPKGLAPVSEIDTDAPAPAEQPETKPGNREADGGARARARSMEGAGTPPTPKPLSPKPAVEPQAAVGFRRGPRQDFSPRPKGKS